MSSQNLNVDKRLRQIKEAWNLNATTVLQLRALAGPNPIRLGLFTPHRTPRLEVINDRSEYFLFYPISGIWGCGKIAVGYLGELRIYEQGNTRKGQTTHQYSFSKRMDKHESRSTNDVLAETVTYVSHVFQTHRRDSDIFSLNFLEEVGI